jgi:hypothetical protein
MADEPDEKYEVRVKGPGIAAEKNVALPKALSVLQIIFGQDISAISPLGSEGVLVKSGSAGTGTSETARTQPLSVREFLAQVAGKSIHAKIAAAGRYMRDYEGLSDFSRDDIKVRFRSAGELMPGNYPRDFQKAVQVGWIGEDPQNRGRFYVTRTGDEAIDRKFEGATSSTTRSRRRRKAGTPEDREEP